MWASGFYRQMKTTSRPGATVSTYSIARKVRDGLTVAGFTIDRKPGFGRKAEMLTASLPCQWQPQHQQHRRFAIIGAGIAGAMTALQLQQRQQEVTLIDQNGLFGGASGAPQVSVHPQLTLDASQYSRFSLAAYQYLRMILGPLLHEDGFLRQPSGSQDRERQTALADLFNQLPGWLKVTDTGLLYDKGGWFEPAVLSHTLLSGLSVDNATITDINYLSGEWQLTSEQGNQGQFTDVIIATGSGSQLEQLQTLPTTYIGGTCLQPAWQHDDQQVYSGAVSRFPSVNGLATLGSTYQHLQTVSDFDKSLDLKNLRSAISNLDWIDQTTLEAATPWHGIRLASRDRRPLVGPMPDFSQLDKMKGPFRRQVRDKDIPYIPGLWINTAFGSHGMTHAPFAAEYLVSRMCGEVMPLDQATRRTLAAERFYLRDRRQSQA